MEQIFFYRERFKSAIYGKTRHFHKYRYYGKIPFLYFNSTIEIDITITQCTRINK